MREEILDAATALLLETGLAKAVSIMWRTRLRVAAGSFSCSSKPSPSSPKMREMAL